MQEDPGSNPATPKEVEGYCPCAQTGVIAHVHKAQKEDWLVRGLEDHGRLSVTKNETRCRRWIGHQQETARPGRHFNTQPQAVTTRQSIREFT